MGPVFRAYEPDQDRLVAVKLLRLDLPPERVHRLVAELEALMALDLTHPAIAAPLVTGIADLCAYLAQDFVAADSADIVLRNHGPAPAIDAVRVATQLAGALDFAAAAGVTHGSLHPRDVLISPDDTRLTGLGILRAVERVGVATPARRPYTAPERAAGGLWDRRADIFSLAALTCEMLSGKRITGAGAQAVDGLPEVPGADAAGLRAVFTRALAERPEDRFQTALAFAEALSEQIASRPQAAIRRPQTTMVESRPEPMPLPVAVPHAVEEAPLLPLASASLLETPVRSPNPMVVERPIELDRPADLSPVDLAKPVSLPEVPASVPDDLPIGRPSAAVEEPMLDFGDQTITAGRLPSTSTRVWPLALAVGIGLAVGFAGGYGVASRDRLAQSLSGVSDGPAVPPPASTARAGVDTPPNAATEARVEPRPAVAAPNDDRRSVEPPRGAPAASEVRQPATEVRSAKPAAAPESGRILVRSTPAGATVTIDGRNVGATPVAKRDLDRGLHTVRVSREGYVAEQRRVTITAARPSQSLTIELAPSRRSALAAPAPTTPASLGHFTGRLLVDSRPSGANVFVDNKPVGTTPLMLDTVDAGDHAVRLERDGYRRWTSSVRVVSGEGNRVTASLER